MESVPGQFFVDGRPKAANKVAYDPIKVARLWQTSAGLVGLELAIT
jgi:hypothetical protein